MRPKAKVTSLILIIIIALSIPFIHILLLENQKVEMAEQGRRILIPVVAIFFLLTFLLGIREIIKDLKITLRGMRTQGSGILWIFFLGSVLLLDILLGAIFQKADWLERLRVL